MGRLMRGTPLVVILVAAGIAAVWAISAIRDRVPETDVRTGDGPTFIWGDPAGSYEGEEPRSVLMLIHGGGWAGIDRGALGFNASLAALYQNAGYATMAVDYRAGAQGLTDIERFYREARDRVDPDTPLCAVGESAGGNLALLLAEREPDVDCVIAEVAPTDLRAWAESSPAAAEATQRITTTASGPHALQRFSPAVHPDSSAAEVFLLYAQHDPVVGPDQGEAMKRALPQSVLRILGPGDAPFGHILPPQAQQGRGVDPEELNDARAVESAFLDRVAAGASG